MASKPKKQAVRLEPTPQELEQQMNELRNFMARERRQELFDLQRLTPNTPRDLEFERHLAGKATPTFSESSKASQPAFGMYPQMKAKRAFNDREAAANAPLSALRGLVSGTFGLAGDVESLGRMAIPNASERTFFPSSEDFQRVLPGRDLTATPTGAAAQFVGNLFADAGIMGTAKAGTAAAKLAGKGIKGLGKLTAEQIAKGMEGSGPLATALAPVSNRYMFIGPKAETWNPSKAEQAVKMEAAGKTPQEIWATTGTFRGADGNLRQEISDKSSQFMFEGDIKGKARAAKEAEGVISDRISESKSIHPDLFPKQLTQAQKDLRGEIRASKEMRQKPGGLETLPYRGNLAEIAYENPELYKAYPELANWLVKQSGDRGAFLASMSPGEVSIYKRGLTQDPRSSATHEFQHAVQGLEGWAPGGNTAMAFQDPEAFKILEQLRKEVATPMSFEDYVKKGGYDDDKETLARARQEYKDYVEDVPINAKKYDVDLQRRAAEEYYQRLTGEAESRATQARIDMTPEQRAAKFPAESYDRPQDVLINKPPHDNIVPERVNFSENPDAMRMDLADQQFQAGGIVKLGKVGKGAKSATRKFMDVDRGTNIVKETGGEWFPTNVKQDMKRYKSQATGRARDPVEIMAEMRQVYTPEAMQRLSPEGKVTTQRAFDDLERKIALNKWVEGNLTNYVKKQMGTADDPVRKLAEEGVTHNQEFMTPMGTDEHMMSVREKAGFPKEGLGQSQLAKTWENISDEAIVAQRAGDIQAAPMAKAKAEEARALMRKTQDDLDAKFVKYARDKGFNEDEVDALLKTQPYGRKAKMVGDTEFEGAYENYMKSQGTVNETLEMLAKDNPWISKLDPEAPVYQPYTYGLGFDHILDVLREDLTAGRIRPEQLNKVSMEQAVRRTAEYDQELAAKVNAAKAAAREGLPVYKEYPEGYKWIELNKPGSLAAESEAMGHSVRGYEPPKGHPDWIEGSGEQGSEGYGHGGWGAIKSGRAKVYSLVNPKGEPHVTVEAAQTPHPISTSRRGDNFPDPTGFEYGNKYSAPSPYKPSKEQLQQIHGRAQELWSTRGTGRASDVDRFYQQAAGEILGPMPEKITQVKGKSNRAPNEEYLPYVQDFVRSGKWSEVGDIQNTGLRPTSDAFNEAEQAFLRGKGVELKPYIDPEETARYQQMFNSTPNAEPEFAQGGAVAAKMDGNDFVLAAQAAGLSTDTNTLNKIVTRVNKGESLQEAARAVAQEGGGSVHISDNPDTMRLELDEKKFALGGIVKAGKAVKAGKGLYSAVDKAALGLKRPMGTGKEFMAEIKSTPGVKATELKGRKLADIEAMPKMTKDKFIKELEARPPIKIEEKVLGQPSQQDIDALADKLAYEKGRSEAYEFSDRGDDIEAMTEENYRLSLKHDWDDLQKQARETLQEGKGSAYHQQYTIPGGENYREILLKMPMKTVSGYKTPNGAFFTEQDLADPIIRQAAKTVGLTPATRKVGQEYPGVPQHFGGEPNILASIRVSDRMVPQPPELRYVAVNKKSGFPSQDFATREELDAYIKTLPPQIQESLVVKQTQIAKPPQKVLHVEEIQSDWHQAGRKARTDEIKRLVDSGMSKQEAQAAVPEDFGYSSNMAARRQELGDRYKRGELSLDQYDYLDRELTSVPDAPFKKDWQELALRKVMELASEGGYDKVALTPGAEQASRYDLSKQVDQISYELVNRSNPPAYRIKMIGAGRHSFDDAGVHAAADLPNVVGKELAQSIVNDEAGSGVLRGLDLKVGGEGMESFYDKMLPDYLNKLGKQYGVQVGTIDLPYSSNDQGLRQLGGQPSEPMTTLHGFEVTPEMRQDITEKGLPLYQQIGVPIGAGAVGAEANDQPVEGMKAGGVAQKSIKDRIAEHRATKERKFQAGGAVRMLKGVSAAERAAAGRKAAEMIKAQPQVKASEALGQAREKGMKTTTTTQADRTRVGGGNIGGGAFSAISEADPLYAGKAWGVMDEGTASRLINLTNPQTAWTTMLGSADQLKTNPIVFAKLEKQFKDAMKAGKLSPELERNINRNLAVTFGEGADIRDPKIWKQADTFEKRAALADLMMGQGLPPKKGGIALGGEKSGKGVIFKPTETLIRETEPTLLHPEHGGDVPTFAAGPRLFTLSGQSSPRPDLHPGFPELLEGKDLGYNVKPTPTEIYLPDWHKRFKEVKPERRQGPWSPEIIERRKSGNYTIKGAEGPGYYDLALGLKGEGLPSQEITDEYIRHLIREGFKEGGAVKKKTKNQRKLDKPRVKISSNPDTMYMELNSKRK